MGNTSLRRFAGSILLFFLVAAGLALALRYDRSAAPAAPAAAAQREAGPREIWRCHACAMIEGKNWATCKTVTGRGTEKAASDLVKQRVCAAARDSQGCRITRIKCRQLTEEQVRGQKTVKVHVVEE